MTDKAKGLIRLLEWFFKQDQVLSDLISEITKEQYNNKALGVIHYEASLYYSVDRYKHGKRIADYNMMQNLKGILW